jgi:hypothetical protein
MGGDPYMYGNLENGEAILDGIMFLTFGTVCK